MFDEHNINHNNDIEVLLILLIRQEFVQILKKG